MHFFHWPKLKMQFNDGTVIEVVHRYALRIDYAGQGYSIGFETACDGAIDRLIHAESIELIDGSERNISEQVRAALISKVTEYCVRNKLTYRIER